MHSVAERGKPTDHFGGSTQRKQTDARNLTPGPDQNLGVDQQSERRSAKIRVTKPRRLRGRDASYLAPLAQIRTCGFSAYGSHLGYRWRYVAACEPTPVSRLSGSESSACLIGPHSPWSLPFAPPTPRRIAPLFSSASQLLWQSQTSRVRSSLS